MALKEYSVPLDFVESRDEISSKGTIRQETKGFARFLKDKGRRDLADAACDISSEIEKKSTQILSNVSRELPHKGVFRCSPAKGKLNAVSTEANLRSGFLKLDTEFFGRKYKYLAFKGIGPTDGGKVQTYEHYHGFVTGYGLASCSLLVKAYLFSLLFHAAACLEHKKNKLDFPPPTFVPLRILQLKEAYLRKEDEIPTELDEIIAHQQLPHTKYGQLFYICQDWHRLNQQYKNIQSDGRKRIIRRIGYALYLAHDVLDGAFSAPSAPLALRDNITVEGEMLDPDHFWSPYLSPRKKAVNHESCMLTDIDHVSYYYICKDQALLREFMRGRFPYADEGQINSFLASAGTSPNLPKHILEFRRNAYNPPS